MRTKKTPTVGNSLSARARGALYTVLHYQTVIINQEHSDDWPFCKEMDDVDALTRQAVRLRLHAALKRLGDKRRNWTMRQLLLGLRNCGAQTADEICRWLDIAVRPHICACRHCGRRMR
jgi:hypothetical protein